MYEDSKSIVFMRRLHLVFLVVILGVNVFVSPISPSICFDVFNVVAVVIWIYGFLNSAGIFKKPDVIEGDRIEYTTSVPIVQIGILRVAQFLAYNFTDFGGDIFIIYRFIIIIVVDLVYLVLLLLDKGSYYYESIVEESNDYSVTTVSIEEENEDDTIE